jgi:hypothetical protein
MAVAPAPSNPNVSEITSSGLARTIGDLDEAAALIRVEPLHVASRAVPRLEGVLWAAGSGE